jgi:hypothetical protein
VIIDVQVDRKMPMAERPSRLRVVEERKDGIVVSGAKAGNSVMAQAISDRSRCCCRCRACRRSGMFWGAVPANARPDVGPARGDDER